MDVRAVMDLATSVEGASFVPKADDELTITRAADGVEVAVRLLDARTFPSYRRADTIVVARWALPEPLHLDELDRFHAEAEISVATWHRYGRLYGPGERTFFRAQLLATGLEPERFLAALAHDLGLPTCLPAPAPVALADVRARLDTAPVIGPEQGLLDAMFGGGESHVGEHYREEGGALHGPSSVTAMEGDRARILPVRLRLSPLGLVHVRHVRAVPRGMDVPKVLDGICSESSEDESLVDYHRALRTSDGGIALDFTASFEELDSPLFAHKMHALERKASAYLRPAS